MANYTTQFRKITSEQSVDEQAMTFLRAFVGEFQGKFEEVLNLAEDFKSFAKTMTGHIRELDEFEAHRFLEKRGETKTVKNMREELEAIDIDNNRKVAFIEYLLFHYHKTTTDLFTAKPNSAALAKLEKAIQQYKAVFEEKKQKEEKMKELEALSAQGGKEGVRAKAELKRLQMQDPGQDAKNEMSALQAKLAAKRALANPEEEEKRLYEEEQNRIAEEKRKQEEEERKKKEESKNRLKERAALWK